MCEDKKKNLKKCCLCENTQRNKIHFLISFLQMERKILMKLFFPLSHLKKPEFKKKILFLVKNISKIFFFSLSFTHKEYNGKILHITLIQTPKNNSFKLFSHMNITSPELHIFVEKHFF